MQGRGRDGKYDVFFLKYILIYILVDYVVTKNGSRCYCMVCITL